MHDTMSRAEMSRRIVALEKTVSRQTWTTLLTAVALLLHLLRGVWYG